MDVEFPVHNVAPPQKPGPKIRVVVRKRPLNTKEGERNCEDIITIQKETNTALLHEPKLRVDMYNSKASFSLQNFCFLRFLRLFFPKTFLVVPPPVLKVFKATINGKIRFLVLYCVHNFYLWVHIVFEEQIYADSSFLF
eukprot:UN14287